MPYKTIKCPKCGVEGSFEIVADSATLDWNYNYNCYSKIVFCTCKNCNVSFSAEELYDIIGYDEDSVKIEEAV